MSTVTATLNDHTRRLNQHETDIHHIYDELRDHRRRLRWLEQSMMLLLERFDIEPPDYEEE